jgi:tight adherence protein C
MILLLASLSMLFSAFLLTRMLLVRATARWQEEKTARKSSLFPGEPQDWTRTVLAVTGRIFSRVNRIPKVVDYRLKLRQDNIAAADPWNLNEYELLALSELAAVVIAVLAWLGMLVFYGSFNFITGIALGIFAGFLPGYIITQRAVQRRIAVNRALPFSLDLMVLCMEAGSSFLESIQTLVDSDPASPLAQEFNYFLQSVRHGKIRRTALDEMAERVRSDDLKPVADAINTGEEMGTPVGRILRFQSEGLRNVRSQRAEKLAAEASSKILFPTLLIVLAVMLMLMGPVIIKMVHGDWF